MKNRSTKKDNYKKGEKEKGKILRRERRKKEAEGRRKQKEKGRRRKEEEEDKGGGRKIREQDQKKSEKYRNQKKTKKLKNLQKTVRRRTHPNRPNRTHVGMVPLCVFFCFSMGGPETTRKILISVFKVKTRRAPPQMPNSSRFTNPQMWPLQISLVFVWWQCEVLKPLFL